MFLDVPFTSKSHKPQTDQGLEETQTESSQEDESITFTSETTGSNVHNIL